jgi:hypothetical protein
MVDDSNKIEVEEQNKPLPRKVYIYKCTYAYICINIYIYVYINIYVYIQMCENTCIKAQICSFRYKFIHT